MRVLLSTVTSRQRRKLVWGCCRVKLVAWFLSLGRWLVTITLKHTPLTLTSSPLLFTRWYRLFLVMSWWLPRFGRLLSCKTNVWISSLVYDQKNIWKKIFPNLLFNLSLAAQFHQSPVELNELNHLTQLIPSPTTFYVLR